MDCGVSSVGDSLRCCSVVYLCLSSRHVGYLSLAYIYEESRSKQGQMATIRAQLRSIAVRSILHENGCSLYDQLARNGAGIDCSSPSQGITLSCSADRQRQLQQFSLAPGYLMDTIMRIVF